MTAPDRGEQRLQKVLAELGLASRREAEGWIRAGRLSVNGRLAVLGMRVSPGDQLRLDGRLIRQRAAKAAGVLLCHRSPGEPLVPVASNRSAATVAGTAAAAAASSTARDATAHLTYPDDGPAAHPAARARGQSLAERLPRRAGRRFVSVSPMPTMDGGLELLSADGALAARLQRAVRSLEVQFSLRVRGELSAEQQQAIRAGLLDSGAALRVLALEPTGGEHSNRWYRLLVVGASGNEVRQLVERQGVTLIRALRTRLGGLELPSTLARGQWRELQDAEISALLGSPASGR